jgi:lipopolysaccharide/colanic/teichoic acid biosynthesis glycosyltransferase
MVVNAEKMGSGLFVKTESDNKITKIGKLLRATRLDELPQLWNAVTCDMSLVGPRPPLPYHPYKYED